MDQYPTYLTGNTALCADKRWVLARQNRLVILPGVGEVVSVDIVFRSHRYGRSRKGSTTRHYKSDQETLYPVEAAEVLPVSMGTVDTSKNM
ncbi:hypothetical protein F443_14506 [Phytophthora nicotianae P1569]|uniref:Uncharacterized protein n=1 Tax=Phytophthora nicotianae P1569 TaxID=1317065 RepID=V9EL79_PHYNI|nr:hypothetical protein F443_14506 [Phytophthora nicotianae P1569]